MIGPRTSQIKRAQKEKLLLREVSDLIMRIKLDDSELDKVHVSRVKLSPDRSNLIILFFDDEGEEGFKTRLHKLILYKPSLRMSLSRRIESRQTPDLVFKYDRQLEKQRRVEVLLEKIKEEL